MPLGDESLRVVIAGATTLRGKDLKDWIDQSGFPAGEVRLVDEELAAGTLTEVAGEPAVVGLADSSSFDKAQFVFFTGSPAFAAKYGPAALAAGATVIDLSGGLAGAQGACPWIPALDSMFTAAASQSGSQRGRLYISPSASAIVACSLAAAFSALRLARLAITFFQPVSERGQVGIEELESQTIKLLSFQPMPQEVFDAQVAFNLLDRWGPESKEPLSDARKAMRDEVRAYLAGRTPIPAVTLIQAPVFYGNAFSAYAEFAEPIEAEITFTARIEAAGLKATAADEGPSNLSVAGEEKPSIGRPERDPGTDRGYWFWGAADNVRVATANAVRIAERLLAS